MSDAELAGIGERYTEGLRQLAPDAEVIVDKFLTNFLQTGLLRRAVPGARFIHVRRAPMDNGFGIFRTLFTSTIPYAYDIKEIASAYALTHRLCDHWASVMPSMILQVDYEDLVRDLEGTARQLVEFAGLPWDDACLSFHETERAVQTASAAQVRQPIYASSVDRWKPYEAHLKPMARAFEAAGVPVTEGRRPRLGQPPPRKGKGTSDDPRGVGAVSLLRLLHAQAQREPRGLPRLLLGGRRCGPRVPRRGLCPEPHHPPVSAQELRAPRRQ